MFCVFFFFLDGDRGGHEEQEEGDRFLFLFKKERRPSFFLLCEVCFSGVTRIFFSNVLFLCFVAGFKLVFDMT